MKFFKAAAIIFAATLSVNAFAQSAYSKVNIRLDATHTTKALSLQGIDVSHGILKKDGFITDLSSYEINELRNAGFTCDILIDDVQSFYVNRSKTKSAGTATPQATGCGTATTLPAVPSGFSLGSMAGFFTYQEFLAHLDTMAARYPNLITVKAPISNYQTVGNRPIYWVRISDNANTDESEPEVLYTAIHHAREPLGLSQLIFYMYYLLENYNTNPEVKYAVDNTEMYFVPMINPDGYVYNQTTNPNGGGMWRKNRRNNGNGSFGVDPNRNYDYAWGTTGTSNNGNNETYCGTAPFSEKENQAMRWLIENHNFKIALNYHTYANLLLFPWGYTQSLQCDDHDLFLDMCNNLVEGTELIAEQSASLYEASGDSDDWAYGDTTNKPKVFAMTPELGNDTDGFWPAEDRIIPVSQLQVGMNLKVAYTAGNYAVATDNTPTIITNTSGYFKYNLQRLGLEQGTYSVSISPLSNIQSVGAANSYSGLAYGQIQSDSISYTLPANILSGTQLKYLLEVSNGVVTLRDTLTKIYGNSGIAFNNAGTTVGQWTVTGAFGQSNSVYFNAPPSLADSPNGNYSNGSTATATTTQAIDLTGVDYAYLRFMAKWDIEAGYDYAQVMASINGNSWTPLCGKYTRPGTIDQDFDMPIYDGVQADWVEEEINLADYLGQSIYIRFRRVSDAAVNGDGIFIDDIKVETVVAEPNAIAENTLTGIKLYPNPASNTLYISSKQAANYVVYDVVGKQMLSGNTTGTSGIDIANLSNGLYFVRLTANGKQGVFKFIKQ